MLNWNQKLIVSTQFRAVTTDLCTSTMCVLADDINKGPLQHTCGSSMCCIEAAVECCFSAVHHSFGIDSITKPCARHESD